MTEVQETRMHKTIAAAVGGAAIVAGFIMTIQPALAGASGDGTDGSGHSASATAARHIPAVSTMKIGATSTDTSPPPSSFAPSITQTQFVPPS
jgi:hypothetical protein